MGRKKRHVEWFTREVKTDTGEVTLRCIVAGTSWGRCPHCASNKWTPRDSRPIVTPLAGVAYSLARFQCQKCGNEFLTEEVLRWRPSRNDRCARCGSQQLESASGDKPRFRLWRCKKCGFLMVVEPGVEASADSASDRKLTNAGSRVISD